MRTSILASILALAGALQAQNCGTLAINGTGAPGTDETISITGATPNALAIVLVGPTAGTTSLHLGMLSVDLGLAEPFFFLPFARTDANGDGSLTVTVPNGIPQQFALNGQGMAIGFTMMPFSITACVTNVVAFTIG
jgi:hypothetical protein